MTGFAAHEVFQFAVGIEEDGEKFYNALANAVEDPSAKKLFEYLAGEEIMHAKIFEDMVKKLIDYNPVEVYTEEYFTYLKAFTNNLVFEKQKIADEKFKIKDVPTAIQLAIQQELDSILYYQEIKQLVPEDQRHFIDGIIEQERLHFLRLSKVKETCSTN